MPKRIEVSLSDLQLAVMRVLWQQPGASTADVVEALAVSRPLAHTTVATLLTRLEKRGLVAVVRNSRQLHYEARVTEAQVRRSMVASLLGSLFDGDGGALLAHLVREDEVNAGDLERIETLLENAQDAER